jgi:hypothetical protein
MTTSTRILPHGAARLMAAASLLTASALIGTLSACSGKAAGPAPAATVNTLESEDLKVGAGGADCRGATGRRPIHRLVVRSVGGRQERQGIRQLRELRTALPIRDRRRSGDQGLGSGCRRHEGRRAPKTDHSRRSRLRNRGRRRRHSARCDPRVRGESGRYRVRLAVRRGLRKHFGAVGAQPLRSESQPASHARRPTQGSNRASSRIL